ncbi:MAG: DUF3858 domain-containing protein, partial [Bacteroidota bacterium]
LASKQEKNLMLLAVLRALDIEAFPLLTSTRSHGKLLPEYAILDQFDYVLVQANIDGKPMLLDVGDPLRPMGYPALDALNYKAWLVDGKTSRWIDIKVPTTRNVFQVKCDLNDSYLKGHVQTKYTGYGAISERNILQRDEVAGEFWGERLAALSEDFSMSAFSTKNETALDQDFYSEFDFSINDLVMDNEDMLYISPTIYTTFKESPFKAKKRYSNIDFSYPFTETYLFEFSIPAGYEIEQLPESTNVKLPSDGGRFRYSVSSKADKIHIHTNLQIKQCRFSAAEYQAVKMMFDLMIEKQEEQIVLRKMTE